MSFGRPASSNGSRSNHGGPRTAAAGAAQFVPRPASSSRPGSARRSDSSESTKWEMSLEEFKRQVQNQFSVVLSWDEVRALQKLYGEPDAGGIDFMKFAVALGRSPGHGPDNARRAYNFLPKHTTEYDLKAIEKKIMHKLEDRCEVAGNYQYQWARRMLCDPTSTLAGGMDKEQLKLRLSGLLGVELSDGEMDVLFHKYADSATGRVHMQSFATRLLAPGRNSGWFILENQMREKVVTNRISPSCRYYNRPGVDSYKPLDSDFPRCLKGFKWDMEKLVAKLKVKLREHAKGIAGYQFLAACKLFRSEVAPGQRKGGRISAEDFRRVVEYKFGMKLDPDEVLTLFHFLVPGAGDSIEIAAMVRVLEPDDYTDSWFNTRESTDMFGFTKPSPEKVVLQAKKMNVGGSWNLKLIEDKIREKIHERVGGTNLFEVQAAYTLFQDGRNTGLTKKGFQAQMHDKFAVVLSQKDVDDVFRKYDPQGTGKLDVHNFVKRLVSPAADNVNWFRDKDTYEFHVLNRAPMKKDPMKAECWKITNWTFRLFEKTLRDKLLAKSNQDGGRFAFKSAVNLIRSANPDHLDSSHMDREALKFIVFRRFDIVMDDHLMDEVFARFDPEGSGKVSVHRLVQHLLPSAGGTSHHLVPKTDEQGQATKTLLGKIFGMTGKRREMISLNGSGVEDPQGESLLERMAAGDKGDGEKMRTQLAQRAKEAAAAAAAAEIEAVEAARNGVKVTPATLAAAAARRRDNSPLAFSGDRSVNIPPGAAVAGALSRRPAPRPETTSKSSSSGSSEPRFGGGRGRGNLGRWDDDGGGDGRREGGGGGGGEGGSRQSCHESSSLEEREERLNEREAALRRREDAVAAATAAAGEANSAVGVNVNMNVNANAKPRTSRRERDRPASATPLRRPEPGGVGGSSNRRPASRAAGSEDGRRPTCSRGSRDSLEQPNRAKREKEEAALIARCRAMSVARRTAATAEATRRRETLEKTSHRPETEANEKTRTTGDPEPSPNPVDKNCHRSGNNLTTADEDGPAAETPAATGNTAAAPRTPRRPQSAAAARRPGGCPRPTSRPQSASTSLSSDGRGDGARAGYWGATRGGGVGSKKTSPRSESVDGQERLGTGAPAHYGSSRCPSSAGLPVGDRGERYRKRLDSAYATQMRAMQRLQKRQAQSSHRRSPERPASGGCEGVSTGQFKSRYSGLDRFVLANKVAAVPTGASRFGGGVSFYG